MAFNGFALPQVQGRGAGLGNELFSWGKAFIAGQTLGLQTLHPAWGLNRRGYSRHFSTSRLDWIAYRGLERALSTFTFSEPDYRKSTDLDLAAALRAFAEERDLGRRKPYLLRISGMWGGFRAVAPAREFLRGRLLTSRDAAENLHKVEQAIPPGRLRVGVHVRRGDFGPEGAEGDYRSRFNLAVPLAWYSSILRTLRSRFGDELAVVVASDAPASELKAGLGGGDLIMLSELSSGLSDISDLLALSACDLIVCSISTFSLWAAFFSDARYLWLRPQLHERDGWLSIWGAEPAQTAPGGETWTAEHRMRVVTDGGRSAPSRGVAVGWDGTLPPGLLNELDVKLSINHSEGDLLRYGVINASL